MKTLFSRGLLLVSLLIALLVLITSGLGLLHPGTYSMETANWRMQAQGQDIGNLVAAVVLIASAYGMKRKSFVASLIWVGTIFYLLYAFIIYAIAVHFGGLFLVYTAILGLIVYSLFFWGMSNPLKNATAHYPNKRAITFAANTLIATGVLFTLLWLSEIVPALMNGTTPKSLIEAGLIANPVHVIDLSTVLPAMILTGFAARKLNRTGLFFVAPWLAFTAIMGISVVAATVIIAASGEASAFAPMVIISVIVALATLSLIDYVRHIKAS